MKSLSETSRLIDPRRPGAFQPSADSEAELAIRRAFGGRPRRTRPKRWNEWKLIYLLECGSELPNELRIENGILVSRPNPAYGKPQTLTELAEANREALLGLRQLLDSVGLILPEEVERG